MLATIRCCGTSKRHPLARAGRCRYHPPLQHARTHALHDTQWHSDTHDIGVESPPFHCSSLVGTVAQHFWAWQLMDNFCEPAPERPAAAYQ
jgi:hypothetical protein